MFLFWFSRDDCFLDRACRPSLLSSIKFFWENLWHGKVNLNISELSAENGVAVVNAYGSIIGDNEDHVDIVRRFVDICTSSNWKYPLFSLEFEKVI